ncbi:MAG: DUF4157 domain-containing protein [Deltaproteobacteria bacterium]|nr:DUF4157 domain-containing protein [Deltaproteobacteria bacterium]
MKAVAPRSPDEDALDVSVAPIPGRRTRTMRIQRRGATAAPSEAPDELDGYVAATRGGGGRLRGPLLQTMNDAFGHDFANVGIHTDGAAAGMARALGAHAFTYGTDVHFAAGRFDPSSSDGQALLGHELAHVVQQGGATPRVQAKLAIGDDGDAEEREADVLGERAARLVASATPSPSPSPAPAPAVAASAPMIRRMPAPVGFGTRDTSIVSAVPDLIQSHIATTVAVTGNNNWDWIWRSRWIVYDASDKVVDTANNWKHPDYTLTPATIKKGVPSDGGANQWTVRFETTETGKPFGGDSASNFPWDQSRFHVYASPIANPHFTPTPERGSQVVASDTFTPAEDGASYSLAISGTLVRSTDASSTVTSSMKTSHSTESTVGFSFPLVSGGLTNKVGFEASKQIATSAGYKLSESQTEARTFSQSNLQKGKKYEFTVYPKFIVLNGRANVLRQNMGIVAGNDDATGSIRVWTGYEMVAKDNASHDSDDGAKAPWERAKKQKLALADLGSGTADRGQRDFLIEELRRQVPDVGYMEQVAAGARTVLTLIIPGNGPLGVKTLNDDLVGYQINNSDIAPQRNAAVKSAFERGDGEHDGKMPFVVGEQTYKSTTVTSTLAPAKLRDAMKQVLHAIDRDVKGVLLRGLNKGLVHWKAERDRTPDDTDEHREAERRVGNIEKAIALVEGKDFVFDFQFGMAAIERGAGGGAPGYAAALEARMHASQAALMSRDDKQPRSPDTDVGDRRGQIYDRDTFLHFCRDGEQLREQVIASGNRLTHHGHTYAVFVGTAANRDVLRDVRKDKIKDPDLASDQERQTLALFKRYFMHVNAFDNIREFMSTEVGQVGEQIARAQKLIDSLKGDGPVDVRAVTDTLHRNPGTGDVIPTTGTASEAVFYNAERERTERIIVSCDIKDMGVDLVQHYGNAMHRVGSGHEDPDHVTQQASDPMIRFRRRAIQRVRQSYQVLVREAIAAAEKRGDHELAEQLRAEMEPSLLMGGDEITLSLHAGLRPYQARLAAALADPDVARARVATSTTGTDPANAVDDHIKAQQAADPAHSVLKGFEAAQRDLELLVAEIPHPDRQREGAALVKNLGLNLLFAENDGAIVLRRSDTNAVQDPDELRRKIEATKQALRELKDRT